MEIDLSIEQRTGRIGGFEPTYEVMIGIAYIINRIACVYAVNKILGRSPESYATTTGIITGWPSESGHVVHRQVTYRSSMHPSHYAPLPNPTTCSRNMRTTG